MDKVYVTTPFGRRAMSLGMLASQRLAETIEPGISRSKWKLFRAICEARQTLGVTDRALTVLDALLTFYPADELSEDHGLIVFPSNAQLSIRARGMTGATLRRHLAGLVEAGLILRKDSANGKRYARRGRAGEVQEAFGFSLAPLLARAAEIEAVAAQAVADREHLRIIKQRVTICRRDIAKLIAAGIDERVGGEWERITLMFRSMTARLPRTPRIDELVSALEEMDLLREEIVNLLDTNIKTQKLDSNESQTERHIQNSNPNSAYELEPRFETKQGVNSADHIGRQSASLAEGRNIPNIASGAAGGERGRRKASNSAEGGQLKSFPLGLVLRACPDVADYAPRGQIANWRDLMTAAVVIRSMLGVSPSAYQEACEVMGPENAAVAVACILERAEHINSAGGYLRDLTRKAERGEFGLGPMLMAALRANGGDEKRSA
ncbi:plasmid replication protein RepC [Shinella sp.]|uniref:plasmid replication protein RepC n=1 Tax=Shinella sp. TaxID=1870904 RepID=UPI0029BDBDD5|nr:plasmid replication protein RepC [Shinella sp.]MDX3977637.1 plasmid replication protein RepC [Shinella sp.]